MGFPLVAMLLEYVSLDPTDYAKCNSGLSEEIDNNEGFEYWLLQSENQLVTKWPNSKLCVSQPWHNIL